jgi:CMP/dCMP kinase
MSYNNNLIIAIDGTAASGKSSTSISLAQQFNLLYVDTGIHYRALTAILLKHTLSPENQKGIEACLNGLTLSTEVVGVKALIRTGKYIFTEEQLRSKEVNTNVSLFAAIPSIRQYLLSYQRNQRQVAQEKCFAGLIMEGRDVGSVIFPEAKYKFFLEADPKTRSQRRVKQGIQDKICRRDQIDSERKISPLVCLPDAIKINTSRLTLQQVIDIISKVIRENASHCTTSIT